MHDLGTAYRDAVLPRASDPALVTLGLARWREAVAESHHRQLSDAAKSLTADPAGRAVLEAMFGNSPYLTQLCILEPEFLHALLKAGPDAAVAEALASLKVLRSPDVDESRLAAGLRAAKRRIALAVALADISGLWPLGRVVDALSSLAEIALSRATAFALRQAAADGAFALKHADDPERESGVIVLAFGKLGARELNYSSDIDIAVFFDRDRIETAQPDRLQNHIVRLVRHVKRLMEERTADGYVFRTDLRLRPDPGATPLAISALAAEIYYESQGQNWERAAMIKARPVAGDLEAGQAFLRRLRPYVWRKNLDFAAIQDIHSIKRQITAHRGGGTIAVEGHNIKLGRGGIREIEFFVQTQQLIWGGREPRLRTPATLDALRMLVACGLVDAATMNDLTEAYGFLRRVEHRLQMIDDEQTHALPEDSDAVRKLAVFLGYDDRDSLADVLLHHLRRVEARYARLFEDAPSLGAEGEISGNLVFTGVDADPETIKTIRKLGFENAETIHATIRAWHHGRYRATRSTRARELLTELMPALLKAFAETPEPDTAFLKFDEFLSHLPAGVPLFSTFYSNPHLLRLIAEIMGGAPRLAEHLSRQTSVLESVLAPDFFEGLPPVDALDTELARLLSQADNLEDVLNVCRRWSNDRQFQVGVQSLRGDLDPAVAARALSHVAETALRHLHERVAADFGRQHPQPPSSAMATVALGTLGAYEMTPASDLDLIFVYETPSGAGDADAFISPSQYFARLAQRLINAVTALTPEGRLYQVDMRLRPSGSAGPIASNIEGFIQYHETSAWTWEKMALTRARAISGPPKLRERIDGVIRGILAKPHDPDRLLLDVADMRARMVAEQSGTELVWDLKHRRGGLVDIEYLVQYLELRHAHAHPDILSPNTWTALQRLAGRSLIAPEDAAELLAAFGLWQALQGLLHLTIEGGQGKGRGTELPKALQAHLAKLGGAGSVEDLEAKIRATAERVYAIFKAVIETPAAALKDRPTTQPTASR
ncbi:MAG: bifunctional [glutamine synthetase] adenylyltransferase/[glutamine synthetase]-adenylyl-L-tyrosine phosphorylase [Rhodospirillales bacterium]|nr:bifunctional [glutamine synthetase] adenylyltransferase/[glutamine synthetase]-adenylyl-L-tyrosine phosphorylase [Rhodospirillales bacterium]